MNALYLLLYAGARKRLLYAVSKAERQRAQGYAERCARLGEEAAKRKGEKKKKRNPPKVQVQFTHFGGLSKKIV